MGTIVDTAIPAMAPAKKFISANELLDDAFRLGAEILASGYIPDVLIALWRGGTPVGIAIQELLAFKGHENLHFAVKTRHYSAIDERHNDIEIEGIDTPLQSITPTSKVLIVDDVFDTGLTLNSLINTIKGNFGDSSPEIRIATPYFKPGSNRTSRKPDYYLHITDKWIVFPHELTGLSDGEILAGKKELGSMAEIIGAKGMQ